MDVWLIAFGVAAVLAAVAGFAVSRLALRSRGPRPPARIPKAQPQRAAPAPQKRPAEQEWKDYAEPAAPVRGPPAYASPEEKGFRIAYKQYLKELEIFVKEVSSASSIQTYHKRKYNELYTFYATSVKQNEGSVPERDLAFIRESLSRAKQIITRF